MLFRFFIFICLVLSACASRRPDLRQAQKLWDRGDKLDACDLARKTFEKVQIKKVQLEAMKFWVKCMAQTGQLSRANSWLEKQSSSAAILYSRALWLVSYDPKNLKKALVLLENAKLLWPQEQEIPYRIGILLLLDQQPKAALPKLEHACKLEKSAHCQIALAHALLDLGRTKEALEQIRDVYKLSLQQEDLARGRALIKRIAKRTRIIPKEVQKVYYQARENFFVQDQPELAISKLQEILVDHPNLATIHNLLGICFFHQNNIVDAVVSFKQASDLNPFDPTNPFYLGLIYKMQGNKEKAIQFFRRALQLDPFFEYAVKELADIWDSLRNYKQQALVLDHLVALMPGNHVVLRRAARVHMSLASLVQSKHYFERVLEIEPKDFEANLRLAQICYSLHDQKKILHLNLIEQTRSHLRSAAAVKPNDPEVQKLQANINRRGN